MGESDECARQLRVKVGVVKRTAKELTSYRDELAQQRAKIEEMKATPGVHDKMRQWEQVAEETAAMVPDTEGRLAKAVDDLRAMMADVTEAGFQGLLPLLAESEKALAEAAEVSGSSSHCG